MPFASVDAISLCYETHGDRRKPAIVLIRGLGTQLIEWPRALLDALVAGGLFVVAFDNRDAGLSSEVAASAQPPYRLEDMANDVVGLCDALAIDRAHVFGISMGGMIAQHVAFARPERMRSMISVMSSSGNPDLPRPPPELFARLDERADAEDAVVVLNAESRAVFGSPGYPESEAVRVAAARAAYRRSYRPDGIARQMRAVVADASRVERLRRVDLPTLVIHGRDDKLVPSEAGADTARSIAGAELVVVPGMGHNIPAALAPEIARITLDFIARRAPAA